MSLSAARRVQAQWRREGPGAVLRGGLATLLRPALRHHRRLIWEAKLEHDRPPSEWSGGETLTVIGPENIDVEMTPGLRHLLIANQAAEEIEGLRGGDRLFVVSRGAAYLAYSYIFFDTTAETRRQARILGEPAGSPIIGLSYTAPAARGRGLYRKILNEMFRFLADRGYGRAVCEVDPRNTPSNKASAAAGMAVCRELSDLLILKRLLLQKVRTSAGTRWRMAWL